MNAQDIMRNIMELLQNGQEQEAADLIDFRVGNSGEYSSKEVLYFFYDKFKDPVILYNLIISVYTHGGYHFPKKVMIQAKKIAPSIPEKDRYQDLPDGDTITVYRATADPINKARNGISWTTNKNVALWFGYRLSELYGDDYEPLHIYMGTIKRDKIIAYTNQRREYEVIQHSSVKDITELYPTNEEVQKALEWHTEENRHL